MLGLIVAGTVGLQDREAPWRESICAVKGERDGAGTIRVSFYVPGPLECLERSWTLDYPNNISRPRVNVRGMLPEVQTVAPAPSGGLP